MRCKGCDAEKPESEFYRTWNNKPTCKCKVCIRARSKAYRKEHPERCRAAASRWYRANREYAIRRSVLGRRNRIATDPEFAAHSREWHRVNARDRNKDPEIRFQRQAQGKVRYAILTGRLTRPEICEQCGCVCKPHGHHEDYSQPLTVKWLCRACHARTWTYMARHGGDSAGREPL